MASEPVAMEGWIQIRSLFGFRWKYRYGVLQGPLLLFYGNTDYQRSEPKKYMRVESVEKSLHFHHGIVLGCNDGVKLVIMTQTGTQFKNWYGEIKRVLKKSPKRGRTRPSLPTVCTTEDSRSSVTSSIETMNNLSLSTYPMSDSNANHNVMLFLPAAGTSLSVNQDVLRHAERELKLMCASGSRIPDRGHLDDPNILWKQGKPNYALCDYAYLKGRTYVHDLGSLEHWMENKIKLWEMETSHKQNIKDWQSIDPVQYTIQVNNGDKYNCLEAMQFDYFSWPLNIHHFEHEDNQRSSETLELGISKCFPHGFPWELLQVFTPPPRVTFSWRHWGTYSGHFKQYQGNGQVLQLNGFAIVDLNEDMRISNFQIFYKIEDFMQSLYHPSSDKTTSNVADIPQTCPFSSK